MVNAAYENNEVVRSEESQGYLNAAIANLLKYHHNIDNDIADVLQTGCRTSPPSSRAPASRSRAASATTGSPTPTV